jgi:hypothetical protein
VGFLGFWSAEKKILKNGSKEKLARTARIAGWKV